MAKEKEIAKLIGSNLLEPGTILNTLKKVVPHLNPFFSAASAAGYGASQIISFLRHRVENPNQAATQRNLEQREGQNLITGAEQSLLEAQRASNQPWDLAESLPRAIGAGVGALGAISGAFKGQPKEKQQAEQPTDPRVEQVQRAQGGLDMRNAEQRTPRPGQATVQPTPAQNPQPVMQPVSDNQFFDHFLSQYPQLGQFIQKQISANKTPEETYTLLKKSPLYSGVVKRLEEGAQESFLDTMKRLFFPAQRPSHSSAPQQTNDAAAQLAQVLSQINASLRG